MGTPEPTSENAGGGFSFPVFLRRGRGWALSFALLAYLGLALNVLRLPDRLTLLLAVCIGPAAIVGVLGLSERLSTRFSPPLILSGTIFLTIAFTLMTLMVTMQQAIYMDYQRSLNSQASLDRVSLLNAAFSLVNHIQLGADVAFDVFYSIGIVATSLGLVRGRGVPRLVGAYGLVVASVLFLTNIGTFPTPPASAGYPDFGPFTVVWWLGLIHVARRNEPNDQPLKAGGV